MTRRELLIGGAAALLAPAAAARPPAGRGLWRDSAGPVAVGHFPEFGPGLFRFDYAARRVGPLGAAEAPAPQRTLREIRIERHSFEAPAEGATLSAELATPANRPARGTVLMIYGSGAAPKEAFDLWAFWFLASGYQVLSYDKRGSGGSTGDWRRAGLETLAADARAVIEGGMRHGVRRPLIAWGASQAGWIAPQLAAAGLVDFIILHAGSAMRPGEQILAQVEAELRAYNFPQAEIERAQAYYALDTDVSRGRRSWLELEAAHREATAAGAEWLLGPPAPADAPERTMIRLMADFDPAPYWRETRVPVLALFGGKDWIVPATSNRAALEHLAASNPDLSTVVLPNANHLMFEAETGHRAEYASRTRIDPGYFPQIERWLERRVPG